VAYILAPRNLNHGWTGLWKRGRDFCSLSAPLVSVSGPF
jgi:hypothetical protein